VALAVRGEQLADRSLHRRVQYVRVQAARRYW
jgi:hypothetical protein